MICEVDGCEARARLVAGMGAVCEHGHCYVPKPEDALRVKERRAPVLMPFGKYKGEAIEDVPSDYFRWLLENARALDHGLRKEIEAQLEMRAGRGVVRVKVETRHALTRPSRF